MSPNRAPSFQTHMTVMNDLVGPKNTSNVKSSTWGPPVFSLFGFRVLADLVILSYRDLAHCFVPHSLNFSFLADFDKLLCPV
jgi:hypothetical protein